MELKKDAFCKAMKNTSDEPVSLVVRVPGQDRLIRVIQPGEVYGIGQLDPSVVVDEEEPVEEPGCTLEELGEILTVLGCVFLFLVILFKRTGGT